MKKTLTSRCSVMLDDDGVRVRAGDRVRFSYGIPPVAVESKIVQRSGKLIALTPGHNPAECTLRSLRRNVGEWYKHTLLGVLAAGWLAGCGGGDDTNIQNETTNQTGIALPTNATEVVDGVYIYQTGDGNWMQLDITTGETTPATVAVVQSGSNNSVSVSVRPFVPPPAEPEAQ